MVWGPRTRGRPTMMTGEAHSPLERRTRPRAQVHIAATLRTAATSLAVQTLDLSGHGTFVRSARPLPVGSAVQIVLQRGAQRNPLVLSAEVVRIGTHQEGRAPGLGLRFTDVTAIDEASLQALIDHSDGSSSGRDFVL